MKQTGESRASSCKGFRLRKGLLCLVLLCLGTLGASAQRASPAQLYESGARLYERAEYDSAAVFLQKAFEGAKRDQDWQQAFIYSRKLGRAWARSSAFDKTDALSREIHNLVQKHFPQDQLKKAIALHEEGVCISFAGDFRRALDLTIMALRQKRALLGEENLSIAESYAELAADYSIAEEVDSSRFYAEKARVLFDKICGPKDLDALSVINTLGIIYDEYALIDSSIQSYLTCLDIMARFYAPNHPNVALVSNNLSSIYQTAGDYTKAAFYLERAKTIYETDYYPRGLLFVYPNVARQKVREGDYNQAEQYMYKAWEIARELLPPDHYLLGIIYDQLTGIYADLGQDEKSLRFLRLSLDNKLANYGPDALATAQSYFNWANFYINREQWDSAKVVLDKSRAIRVGQLSERHQKVADIDYFLGQYYKQKGRIDLALHWMSKARKTYAAVTGPRGYWVSDSWRAQAVILYEGGRKQEAQQAFDTCLHVLFPRWRKSSDRFDYPWTLAETNQIFINVLNSLSNFAKHSYARSGALRDLETAAYYEAQAIRYIDSTYIQLGGFGQRQDMRSYAADFCQEAFHTCADLYKVTHDAKWLQRAFEVAERSKSMLLRESIRQISSTQGAGIPDSLLRREREIGEGLQNVQARIENASLEEQDSLDGWQQEYQHLRAQNRQFLAQLEKAYPKYAQLKYGSPALDWKTGLAAIPETACAVEYTISQNRIYALVMNRSKPALLDLGLQDSLAPHIRQFKEAMEHSEAGAFAAAAYTLYQKLWRPLEPYLDRQEVIVIPDGKLHYIPFEALISRPAGKARFDRFEYLIGRYSIHYAHSLALLAEFDKLKSRHNGKLAVFAPGFEPAMKREYREEHPGSRDSVFLQLLQQPWALQTADYLSALAGTKVYTRTQATETAFRRAAPPAGILHIGSHAEVDDRSPLHSRFMLAQEGGKQIPEAADGYLCTYELFPLRLQADLAVLTACQTGSGQLESGEGVLSLARGFSYAGCPSLLMSLWSIDDKSSAAIIESFYGKLQEGEMRALSLRKAKQDYLKSARKDQANPLYWAGMIYIGPDGQSPLAGKSVPRWIWPAAALLLGGLAVLYRRRMRSKKAAG